MRVVLILITFIYFLACVRPINEPTVKGANTGKNNTDKYPLTISTANDITSSNFKSYSLDGTCSFDGMNLTIQVGSLSLRTSCSGTTWSLSSQDVSSVSDGSVEVKVSYNSTNEDLQNTASKTISKSVATVSITAGENITKLNQKIYSLNGTCSESNQNVDIQIGSISQTVTCNNKTWTIQALDVSTLSDGTISITAEHINSNIQATSATVKSTSAHLVTIFEADDINMFNETDYVLSGQCSANGTNVDVDINGDVNHTAVCVGFHWSTPPLYVSGMSDGTNLTIGVTHSGATATDKIDKDTSAAAVTINFAQNINSANETNYIVTGNCSVNGQPVEVYVDSLYLTPSCGQNTWSIGAQDLSSISDSDSIIVRADHQGAPQAIKTITKNTTTPSIVNLSAVSPLAGSVELVWELADPGGFSLDDYIIEYRKKGNTTWSIFNDGKHTEKFQKVTGLTSPLKYEFRVKAQYNTTEYSNWSNIAEGETQTNDSLFNSSYISMNVGGATSSTVVALYDNTNVSLNGTNITTLSKGGTYVFTSSQYDVIESDKFVYVAGRIGSGGPALQANVVWMPSWLAGKSFALSANRNNPQVLYYYCIESAVVNVKQGSTLLDTDSCNAGNYGILTWSVYGSFQIYSTGRILAFHMSEGSGYKVDALPLLPASNEIIGIPSQNMYLFSLSDLTNYWGIHSNSTSFSGSIIKANSITISGQGAPTTLYQNESLILKADKLIGGIQYGDSNGNASASFIPTNLMKKKYVINSASDFVAFAAKEAGTIAVYSPTQTIGVDTPVEILTLSRTGSNAFAPYKARRGATPIGYRFIATVPVAGWYQPSDDTGSSVMDETVLFGTNE